MKSHVHLISEPSSEMQMGNIIKSCQLFKAVTLNGDRSFIGVVFDQKTAGESVTQPETRVAPLKEEQIANLLRGCLRGFTTSADADATNLEDGYLYFVLDGGKSGDAYVPSNCSPLRRSTLQQFPCL